MCLREAVKQDVIGLVHGLAYFYFSYVRPVVYLACTVRWVNDSTNDIGVTITDVLPDEGNGDAIPYVPGHNAPADVSILGGLGSGWVYELPGARG